LSITENVSARELRQEPKESGARTQTRCGNWQKLKKEAEKKSELNAAALRGCFYLVSAKQGGHGAAGSGNRWQ
jgi:hypothetical protein